MKIKESEEIMKNSFNWDPTKKDELVGELPTGEKIEIEGDGIYKTPYVPENYVVANDKTNVKKRVRKQAPTPKKDNVLGDVGIGSSGFTSMITLASIIVIAGIIIAYIVFKV